MTLDEAQQHKIKPKKILTTKFRNKIRGKTEKNSFSRKKNFGAEMETSAEHMGTEFTDNKIVAPE